MRAVQVAQRPRDLDPQGVQVLERLPRESRRGEPAVAGSEASGRRLSYAVGRRGDLGH